MSAIGDYIHYSVKNYNKYGFNKAEDGPSVPAVDAYAAQQQSIKSRMVETEIVNKEGIEDALSFIFSTHDSGSQGAEIQAKIQEKLSEIFGETLGRIDWSTGNIRQQLNSAKQGTIAKIQQDANQANMELSTILKRVQALMQIRNGIKNKEDWTVLNGKINDILHNLSDIIRQGNRGVVGQLRQVIDEGISYENVSLNNQMLSLVSESSGEATRSLVAQVNAVLKDYASVPAINLQKGNLFELALAAVPAVARIRAGESVESAMKDFESAVVGGSRTKVKIDLSQFTENLNYSDLQFKGYATSATYKTIISYGASQDKIDVNLQWDSSVLPVSAKNVNLSSKSGVHVVSGTSLLYLLQDENHDFVNHYLNAVAIHNDSGTPNGLQEAHELAKITVLYKAISGDTLGREKATVFIVNDNRTGKVRIFDIRNLVLKAMENIDTYTIITSNGSDMNNIQLPNDWHDSYADRITALIASVHRQKISAILKPNLLQ